MRSSLKKIKIYKKNPPIEGPSFSSQTFSTHVSTSDTQSADTGGKSAVRCPSKFGQLTRVHFKNTPLLSVRCIHPPPLLPILLLQRLERKQQGNYKSPPPCNFTTQVEMRVTWPCLQMQMQTTNKQTNKHRHYTHILPTLFFFFFMDYGV